jgi:hypothetical protein
MKQHSQIDAYRKIAENALNSINADLTKFRVHAEYPFDLIARLKPIAELVLASEIALSKQHDFDDLKVNAKEWIAHCWRELEEGAVLREAIETHSNFLLIAAMYLPFRRNGFPSQAVESAVRVKMESLGASQQYPSWVLLLMIRTLNTLGIDSPWKLEVCFRNTELYPLPQIRAVGGLPGYAFTHTVFFLTDFGKQPRELPEIHRQYLVLHLPLWLEHCERVQNYDLMAEMIMVARCTRIPDTKDWSAVLLASREIERFRNHYHSTLTALMASVMSLNPPSTAVLAKTTSNPMF